LPLSLDATIALLAIAPFLAALVAPWVVRHAGGAAGWIAAIVPAGIFVVLLGFIEPVAAGQTITASLNWIPTLGISFSFFIDGLSLTFALMISGIGTLIIIYSGAYLHGHRHLGRFLSFMLMFMGAMLGVVLASNMLALFGFWELTSVTSFLLIGFDHTRQASRRAAIQALVVTGMGGLALLAGLVLLHQLTGNWDIASARDAGINQHALYPLLLVLFLLGAFTKSAQFPFHFWLPNAMEAPTPVSAYLHSATMVQAGVYLLARVTPVLGGTEVWTLTLTSFGGVTLLWGAIAALRQTDLKQMLAQTTIASLGLLVLLIGVGTEAAISAAVIYFVAHALYKAALFMIAGIIDHETGIRDITALGGLAEKMPATFIAAALAVLSMIGLPLTLGFLGKEEMYLALASGDWHDLLLLVVLVLGNAALVAVAAVIAVRPFLGALKPTPKEPHGEPVSLVAGPLVLGILGIAGAVLTGWFAHSILEPAASGIAGEPVASHLKLAIDLGSVVFWLSVLTWALGLAIAYRADMARTVLRRVSGALGWTFDKGFDAAMFGLIRLAAAKTRAWHHGRLELYLVVLFSMLVLALFWPLISLGGLPEWPAFPDLHLHEWGVLALALIGVLAVPLSSTRLTAILALGIQGFAMALIFLMFGAPDLAFTQFMVEVLSVVILTLVMTKLKLSQRDQRPFEDLLRDGGLALLCGLGVAVLLVAVQAGPLDERLSAFFTATSVPLAHGHNIVNVILVDYRGLDTLGEISVVMAAGIAVLALIRKQKRPAPPTAVKKARARKVKA
jgi:multicomponent Na+:H+ antiporter subunit A